MTDKPEFYAAHPETGKRHRWEVVCVRIPEKGDFFLAVALGEVSHCWNPSVTSPRPILRDLGPVEEEKKETLADLIERKRSESIVLQAIGKEEMVEAFRHKFGLEPEDCELVERRNADGITWFMQKKAEAADVAKDFKIKDLESSSPAPLPVGVVRLRIYATTTNETGVFEILRERRGTRVGDLVLSAVDGKPCAYIANTELENELAFHLRRLDAPEGKLIKPVPLCDLKPGARYRDRPNGPILTRGVDAINATETPYVWPLEDAPEDGKTDKPAPPKRPLGTACPRCHGTGWKVFPYSVTFAPAESDKDYSAMGVPCPDCRGHGVASQTAQMFYAMSPPKEEPKPATSSIPERIPLARDPSMSYWFVREEKKRPPKKGDYYLKVIDDPERLTGNMQALRACCDHDSRVPLVILHRVRMGVEWLDPNWNDEE